MNPAGQPDITVAGHGIFDDNPVLARASGKTRESIEGMERDELAWALRLAGDHKTSIFGNLSLAVVKSCSRSLLSAAGMTNVPISVLRTVEGIFDKHLPAGAKLDREKQILIVEEVNKQIFSLFGIEDDMKKVRQGNKDLHDLLVKAHSRAFEIATGDEAEAMPAAAFEIATGDEAEAMPAAAAMRKLVGDATPAKDDDAAIAKRELLAFAASRRRDAATVGRQGSASKKRAALKSPNNKKQAPKKRATGDAPKGDNNKKPGDEDFRNLADSLLGILGVSDNPNGGGLLSTIIHHHLHDNKHSLEEEAGRLKVLEELFFVVKLFLATVGVKTLMVKEHNNTFSAEEHLK